MFACASSRERPRTYTNESLFSFRGIAQASDRGKREHDEAIARDPASAAAEFGAQFRSDIESFVSREAVMAVVSTGASVRGALENVTYRAFVDPSGGSSDSMTLAIAHLEGKVCVLDCIVERRAPHRRARWKSTPRR